MAAEIYMPQLGLTMTRGTVTRWLKAMGEPVRKGEAILEIETDKTSAEIEAPADGVLGPILVQEGEEVPIGTIVSWVLAPGEEPPAEVAKAVGPVPTNASPVGAAGQAAAANGQGAGAGRRIVASPRAMRLASRLGIDLAQAEATGPQGRIVEADVRWLVDHAEPALNEAVPEAEGGPEAVVTPVARHLAEQLGVDLRSVQGTGPGGRITKEDVERTQAQPAVIPAVASEEGVEPLKGIRRLVAERMTHSFTTTPHFYLSAEVDATALLHVRQVMLAGLEKAAGVRLTVTDILVKVCARALVEFPGVNVLWSEGQAGQQGGVLRQAEVNVGVAATTEAGLLVPVVHRADQLSLTEIARTRADLVERARAKKLSVSDLEGGTFTLTNLGMYRVDRFQAIINSPQAAILAVGRIRERPVVQEGAIVVRPTVVLTLTVDHRLVDGAEGARFLDRVAQLIEEPYLLLA